MERKEFETASERLRPKLFAVAFKLLKDEEDAKDMVQDALLKMWSIRHTLEQYSSVEALGVTIVRNLSVSHLRNSRLMDSDAVEDHYEIMDSSGADEHLLNEDENKVAMKLIGELPDMQQTILRMKHLDGLEVSEIAKMIGAKEEAVRSNLSRARKKILEQFKKEYENEGN